MTVATPSPLTLFPALGTSLPLHRHMRARPQLKPPCKDEGAVLVLRAGGFELSAQHHMRRRSYYSATPTPALTLTPEPDPLDDDHEGVLRAYMMMRFPYQALSHITRVWLIAIYIRKCSFTYPTYEHCVRRRHKSDR